jgi:hypothetical protein
MATIIKRIGFAVAGEASMIALATFSETEIITAVRTGSDNLKLIGWHIGFEGGEVTRAADSGNQAGKVSEIALTIIGRQAVTAVRTASGNLKLISWDVPPQMGNVKRLADSGTLAGAATNITMVSVGGNILITAVRTASGNLKLISWKLSSNGMFTRLGDSGNQAGAVGEIATSYIGGGEIVTAVRNSQGNLVLILWRVSQDGMMFTRLGDSGNQAGAVGEIAITFLNPVKTVFTAVQTSSGNLKVIAWDVGGNIRRLGSVEAGTASSIAIDVDDLYNECLTSISNENRLELIACDTDAGNDALLSITGDILTDSGTTTETAITFITSRVNGRAVTACRIRNSLNVSTWSISKTLDNP